MLLFQFIKIVIIFYKKYNALTQNKLDKLKKKSTIYIKYVRDAKTIYDSWNKYNNT